MTPDSVSTMIQMIGAVGVLPAVLLVLLYMEKKQNDALLERLFDILQAVANKEPIRLD